MKVLVTGASGLIGKQLCVDLFRRGHKVVIASRSPQALASSWDLPFEYVGWDTNRQTLDGSWPTDTEAIVHLAGEGIADKRWSPQRRQEILRSRTESTRLLLEKFIPHCPSLKAFVQASAVGYYQKEGAAAETDQAESAEHSPPGDSYLAQVCTAWENASSAIDTPRTRRCVLRIGVVLSAQGGALPRMLPAFAAGLGARLGSGQQWMSWIHERDLVRLLVEAVENPAWKGVFNATSPEPCSNHDFTATLSQTLGHPRRLIAPRPALKVALGELSSLLLGGTRALPEAAKQRGFKFEFPTLREALVDLLTHNGILATRQLRTHQWLPAPLEQVFAFFSAPQNLEKITPALLNFKILSVSTATMEQGTRIAYRLKVHGIPLHWETLIAEWKPPHHFVDTQEKGPYRLWHHTHHFESVGGGTLCGDLVRYKLPFGSLGHLFGGGFVKNDISSIFAYRRKALRETFQKPRL